MAVGVVSPKVPDQNDILLGEGKIQINYTTSGVDFGATRGGSVFAVERTIREMPFDGAYGPTKGLRRKEIVVPKLTINALTINYTNLPYGTGMTVSDEGDYHKVIEDIEIANADYLTDITFIGQKHDGKSCIIIVYNPLMTGAINWNMVEKDEAVNGLEYSGHYDPSTPLVVPYEIRDYDV